MQAKLFIRALMLAAYAMPPGAPSFIIAMNAC